MPGSDGVDVQDPERALLDPLQARRGRLRRPTEAAPAGVGGEHRHDARGEGRAGGDEGGGGEDGGQDREPDAASGDGEGGGEQGRLDAREATARGRGGCGGALPTRTCRECGIHTGSGGGSRMGPDARRGPREAHARVVQEELRARSGTATDGGISQPPTTG